MSSASPVPDARRRRHTVRVACNCCRRQKLRYRSRGRYVKDAGFAPIPRFPPGRYGAIRVLIISRYRCDAARPACSRCLALSRICSYDTTSKAESRYAALQRENERLRQQITECPGALGQRPPTMLPPPQALCCRAASLISAIILGSPSEALRIVEKLRNRTNRDYINCPSCILEDNSALDPSLCYFYEGRDRGIR